jgi:hypothetical protein
VNFVCIIPYPCSKLRPVRWKCEICKRIDQKLHLESMYKKGKEKRLNICRRMSNTIKCNFEVMYKKF